MQQATISGAVPEELTPQRQDLLLTFHRAASDEMGWRRTAGYRTVILGLAYCGLFMVVVGYIHPPTRARACLAAVIALATLFGAGYLVGNYKLYMIALERAVRIEEYVGAFDANFLGALGPLMPAWRKAWPQTPLHHDAVSFGSVLALAAGGLGTALAVLLM